MTVTMITIVNCVLGTIPKRLVEGLKEDSWSAWNGLQELGEDNGGIGKSWENRNHPNYSSIEISQNTEKSPGDLSRLAVSQTPGKKLSVNAGTKNSRRCKIIKSP